jgi:hypothetical protein
MAKKSKPLIDKIDDLLDWDGNDTIPNKDYNRLIEVDDLFGHGRSISVKDVLFIDQMYEKYLGSKK